MNILIKTTQLVHYLALAFLNEDAITVDCTCGNGNDTLFLAENSKFVYGFDIQQKAVDNTTKLLEKNSCSNYLIIKDGHQNIDKYVNEKCDVIVFNLGYLPKGDKKIITQPSTTIEAISKCLELLKANGAIFISIYYGHSGGEVERKELLDYLSSIDDKYMIRKIETLNKNNYPPEIVVITRKTI